MTELAVTVERTDARGRSGEQLADLREAAGAAGLSRVIAPVRPTMTGTVAEREQWSGIALPSGGDYVIPNGLSVLHLDRDPDLGA